MRRKADKAGSWYMGDGKGLRAEVEECVRKGIKAYGGALDQATGKPAAIMTPHAGLFFSGALAGAAFELVRRRWGRVDTFVLFGACHRMRLRRPGIWTRGEWDTPLGAVKVDEELAEAFLEAGVGEENYAAHEEDNALELQLPFIKAMFPDAGIVPVAMGLFPDSWRYGEMAAKAVRGRDAGVTVAVASTDLTHYGASFGVMTAGVGEKALAWAKMNDEKFLDAVVAMRGADIVNVAQRDGSACGAGAAAAAVGWARVFGCGGGRLLGRSDSHEVMPQGVAEHFVGYGAVAFSVDG